jgi:hypothetical protein
MSGKAGNAKEVAPVVQPPRPRPVLFKVLCVVFAIWIGVLLFLYFATVYPRRH